MRGTHTMARLPSPARGRRWPSRQRRSDEGGLRVIFVGLSPVAPLIRHAPHDTFSCKREKGGAMSWLLAWTVFFAFACLPARAVEPGEMLANPALESRARDISSGLRCLVCQNQSIDDSEAPLAHDLRVLVRERISAGDSDTQVRDYLVARYGPYILLKPPVSLATILLWLTPAICLVLGGGAILVSMRRRRAPAGERTLDADEAAALRRLTGEG